MLHFGVLKKSPFFDFLEIYDFWDFFVFHYNEIPMPLGDFHVITGNFEITF